MAEKTIRMTKRTKIKLGTNAVIIGALLLLFAPTLVLAQTRGTVGGSPAFPRDDNPRTKSIFVHTGSPGEVIDEGVLVVNNSSQSRRIRVYATDHVAGSGGGFSCAQYAEEDVGLGSWIALDAEELTLAPQSKQLIPFTITIPDTASVGEHNGCIAIEGLSDEERPEGETGVLISTRSAIRVAVLIPGDVVKEITIESFDFSREGGKTTFVPAVRNSGTVSLDVDIIISIKHFFGPLQGQLGGRYPILRDTVRKFSLELLSDPFWGGWYDVQLLASYDPSEEALPGLRDEDALVTIEGPTYRMFFSPHSVAWVIEITVTLLLLFLLLLLILRIKQKMWIKKSWIKYSVKDGEDIQAVAKTHHVSWRVLAKANKLDAPYSIEAGHELIVPPAKGAKSKGEEPVSE